MRIFRIGLLMMCMLLFGQFALAEEEVAAVPAEETPCVCWLHAKVGEATLNVQATQYGDSLFLPTCADLTAVPLVACGEGEGQSLTLAAGEMQAQVASGEAADIAALFPDRFSPQSDSIFRPDRSGWTGSSGQSFP